MTHQNTAAKISLVGGTSVPNIPLRSELIELQDSSLMIASAKYFLPGEQLDGMRRRLAKALASVEASPGNWEEIYYNVLHYAFPAGRIMANAGAESFKPAVSTINCTVSETIEDSMSGIMRAAHDAALTLRAGCGIGYDFSTLRPKGAFVTGAGAQTSGPLSFMDIFDAICATVSSAGGRRGAQMGVLDVCHPDIESFILAKRKDGRLRKFNLSALIRRDFVDAVIGDTDWELVFPAFEFDLKENCEIVWREWPLIDQRYKLNEKGEVACKVYRRIRARDLFDLIMRSTYDFSDPGFICIDEVNQMNNLWFAEMIRSTNPCGEQPLPPGGSCLLGSVNLAAFVSNPFKASSRFDMALYRDVSYLFSRMLDNVVEMNGLPLEVQVSEIQRKRRHGMGYLGLGSAMTMLGMKYGDKNSISFTGDVSRELALSTWRAGLDLAKEKGPAPIMGESFEVTKGMLAKRPEMVTDGYKVGDKVKGRVLHARYSKYMQRIASVDPKLIDELSEVGARFSHGTSLAPTGTMAASVANNPSNGIEPSFTHFYIRNMIVSGEKAKKAIPMESYELQVYRKFIDKDVDPNNLPECFSGTTSEADPRGHIDVQAAAQEWIDSSISKTINVPTEIDYDEFKGLYLYAVEKGLKGCTTFRFNPEVHQGVLVKPEDLAATTYEFQLADGTKVRAKGGEEVSYDGGVYTAANLYDALKEGFFGEL